MFSATSINRASDVDPFLNRQSSSSSHQPKALTAAPKLTHSSLPDTAVARHYSPFRWPSATQKYQQLHDRLNSQLNPIAETAIRQNTLSISNKKPTTDSI
jgi:hypothetical protein